MNEVELLFRIAKGTALTDLELDDDLRKLKIAVNALIAQFNSGTSPTAPLIGHILGWGGSSLPANAVYLNGQTLSQTTYNRLFAVFGTTYNTGGEPAGTFRVPDLRARVPMGTNPMGGLTNGSLSTRTLGQYVGAEEDAQTPSITLGNTGPYTPGATVGAGTLAVSSHVQNLASNVSVGNHDPISAHVHNLATSVSVADHPADDTGTQALAITGTGNTPVTGASCVNAEAEIENPISVIACASSLQVDNTTIASGLSIDPDPHSHTTPLLTHDVTNGALTGTINDHSPISAHSVVNGPLTGSINNHTVSGSPSYSGTPANLAGFLTAESTEIETSTIQPSIVCNYITYYQ